MNSKSISVLVLIVSVIVSVTLSGALPVQESQQLDAFLSQINGTTCLSKEKSHITPYGCVTICAVRNGVRVCYQHCSYGSQLSAQENQDLDTFVSNAKGMTCFGETEDGISSYGCITVCVVRNGVQVCYQRCNYGINEPKVNVEYDSKCQLKYICIDLPNGQKTCSWNCV